MKKMKKRGNEVMRLAKPKKKGLLRLIFSRFFVIVSLIILQIVIIYSVFSKFIEFLPHFQVIQIIFSIVMVIYLFNSSMDASAKLTWMVIMSVVPVPGAIFFLFTKEELGYTGFGKRFYDIQRDTKDVIEQSEDTMIRLAEDRSGTDELCKYVNRQGTCPIYDKTDVVYFPLGEDKFERLLVELSKAEKYIYLEYFILEEGYMWGKILEILVEKAKAGVDVRVMYDGTCEITTLPHDYTKRLENLGIRSKMFSPLMPLVSTYFNYRDHRKILVIDGRVAFNGGVNLADEYINRKEKFGHWKDTAIMLEGKAAESFALMFLQMWNVTERDLNLTREDYYKLIEPPVGKDDSKENSASDSRQKDSGNGYVMPYADSPLDSDKVGENVYMDILYRANDYVHIMSPYLILDDEMKSALKFAAERGVDVKIILPGIADKKVANALAKSYYYELIQSGVKLYEYTPGFVHAKVFVSDDIKGTVGTINLDYRSLYHHFECATYLYHTSCIVDMEEDFQETLAKCREVTFDTIRKEKLFNKVVGRIARLAAPLM